MMERNVGRPWTAQEDALLRQAVAIHGENDNWKTIAQFVPGRTNKACRKRWRHSLSPNVKKSAWTQEEDELLLRLYAQHHTKWSLIARQIPGRTDDACSKRYREALDPALKKSEWTPEEDTVLLDLYQRLGGKWGQIGQELTRSGLACRNRWRLLERKKTHAQTSVTLDPAPAVQNTVPPSDSSVQSSWPDLPTLDVSYWDPYVTDTSSTSLSVPPNEVGSPGIDASHGIIPRSDPPPFQYTSSSLSSALSTPRRQLRLSPAQPLEGDQQTPQFSYEVSSSQINVDCNLEAGDNHINAARPPNLPDHNAAYLQQLQPNPQAFTLPDAYPRVNAVSRSYGNNSIQNVQISLGDDRAPQSSAIVYVHGAHELRDDHGDIVMRDGSPNNHRSMSFHQSMPGSSDRGVSAMSICIPDASTNHEAGSMSDVCPSPYSSYARVVVSPGPPAVIQLSPAEPNLPRQISSVRSRSSDFRRRGQSQPSAPRAQSARRKQSDRPRKLDAGLPVSSDLSIKAYACGHPLCWLPSASKSTSVFATSHGLSEHCKERHADMNIVAVGSGGNDQPFRCGLDGCGRGWKSLNGLQYHLQVSKAHFIKAISTASAPSSPPATPDDETPTSAVATTNSDSVVAKGSINKSEKRKEHRCPHPSCPNVYKQLSGLRYHLLHVCLSLRAFDLSLSPCDKGR
ncbi:hypothetical protein NEOLEDRAFT_1095648 [Neolentinus lepideus HHB14362 ss-1]|uniref:Uncharacterized protein n=1 Tax=Neolentinus lepideus HHB14362 ss-1 TaxID=1314782 RepID=A0A165RIL1_9AGAM|nr:hypothetical protein NEOLEDRAFT_1095648 [Neolentinus lepideus HHB14362 ss-1]